MESTTSTGRRKYTRRTEQERIKELEARITQLKMKQAAKSKQTDPVLKEIPKIQRRLRKFAQLAMDHNRPDIANSTTAFNAGLERTLRSNLGASVNTRAQAPEPAAHGA